SPFPDDGYTQTTSAEVTGNLDGILNWDDLDYNGSTAEWWVNDAVVHAVMLGFVMSMIMAHAPVILPAVLRRPLPYTRWLYLPVALLHASLLLRIVVGDGRDIQGAVSTGGVLNIVAIVVFVVIAAGSAVRGARPAQERGARPAQERGEQ
ncbi:MAG TPA: hypothetical protein P5061_11660, partial [Mycobacterium sp.]|nr:hypothetical protein [Mycobacterium sp.]